MRKVIFGINLSLDGCCDHTKFGGSEEVMEYFGQYLRKTDLLVYGRKTYQLMVPYWPDIANNPSDETKAEIDFAQAFAALPMIVFSRTLEKAEGKNTRIVRGNLKEEILQLKQAPGKDILVGGVDLSSQLVELNLVDEYCIVVHPVVVGEGRRLWDDASLQEKLPLKLVEATPFKSGCVALRYVKQ